MRYALRASWLAGLALGLVAVSGSAPLQAAPRQEGAVVSKTGDEALKDRIDYRLATTAAVKKYDINVKVANGDVTLTGTVATAAQKTEAGRLAKVTGVKTVDNQLKVDPAVNETLTQRAKAGMNRTGEAVTDTWLTTKVKWFMTGDDLLKGSKIDVSTANRVVTLTGTVPTAAGKARAVALANDADGVLKVVDHLTIGKTPSGS